MLRIFFRGLAQRSRVGRPKLKAVEAAAVSPLPDLNKGVLSPDPQIAVSTRGKSKRKDSQAATKPPELVVSLSGDQTKTEGSSRPRRKKKEAEISSVSTPTDGRVSDFPPSSGQEEEHAATAFSKETHLQDQLDSGDQIVTLTTTHDSSKKRGRRTKKAEVSEAATSSIGLETRPSDRQGELAALTVDELLAEGRRRASEIDSNKTTNNADGDSTTKVETDDSFESPQAEDGKGRSSGSKDEKKKTKSRKKTSIDEDEFSIEEQLRLEKSIVKGLKDDMNKYLDECDELTNKLKALTKQMEVNSRHEAAEKFRYEENLKSAQTKIDELEMQLKEEREHHSTELKAVQLLLRDVEVEAGTLRDHIASESSKFEEERNRLQMQLAESEDRAGRLLADLATEKHHAANSREEFQRRLADTIKVIDDLEVQLESDKKRAFNEIDKLIAERGVERDMLLKKLSDLESDMQSIVAENSKLQALLAKAPDAEHLKIDGSDSPSPNDSKSLPIAPPELIAPLHLRSKGHHIIRADGVPNIVYSRVPVPICSLRIDRQLLGPLSVLSRYKAKISYRRKTGISSADGEDESKVKELNILREERSVAIEANKELQSQLDLERQRVANHADEVKKQREEADKFLVEVSNRLREEKRNAEEELLKTTTFNREIEEKYAALESTLLSTQRNAEEQLEKLQVSKLAAERRADDLQAQLETLKKKNNGFPFFNF